MDKATFHHILRIMLCIDAVELEKVGVFGCPPWDWPHWTADPFRYYIRCDDETADKIWGIIEAKLRRD